MKRVCYLGLGHICVVLGVIGAFVPGLPTVVFLIVAAWAYGKSSEKFQKKIHEHPRYGQMVLNWEKHGVIPLRAKLLAGGMMLCSGIFCFYMAPDKTWPLIADGTMALVFLYILSRPSRVAGPAAMSAQPGSDPR